MNAERRAQEQAVGKSPDATLALAHMVAETVRALNHATLGAGGLAQPAGAYQLLGELSLTASRLPQLLAQVERWLDAALAAGQLGCDDGTDPAVAVGAAQIYLTDARTTAAALARYLGDAQQQLAAVHGTLEEGLGAPTGNPSRRNVSVGNLR